MAKRPLNTGPEVQIARFSFWQAVIVAIITAASTLLVTVLTRNKEDLRSSQIGYKSTELSLIPSYKEIDTLKATPQEKYKLIKDMSIFDLRGWKYVPDSLLSRPISPIKFTNYLHVKKIRELDSIAFHLGSSTSTIPRINCLTHQSEVRIIKNAHHKVNSNMKSYGINIDVSDEPINSEFLIVVESIYYNSFNNPNEENCETYTDNEITFLNELGLMVILPESKAFKGEIKRIKISSDEKESAFTGLSNWYVDKDNRFAYWNIKNLRPNHHYKLKWNW